MTISPVSSVNNNIRNLSFGENQEKPNTKNKSKLSTETKVLIGAGLTALAAVGVYIATRGRKTPSVTEKPLEQLKEMALSQFKNAGNKFEKGRALTSAGEGYTGTLTHTTKSGKNITMKYENGFLVESKSDKFKKIYEYDNKGRLIKITDDYYPILSKSINGDTTYVQLYNNPTSKGCISKNGKLKYIIGKDNTITFYNSDCSIPSGSKLKIRKAGAKYLSEYSLMTPEGKYYVYNGNPSYGLVIKEVKVQEKNPFKKTIITKCKDDNEGIFYTVQKCSKNDDKMIKNFATYDSKYKLIEGEEDNTILSFIKDVKNVHKDIYRTLNDFGGVDKFSSLYC